MTEETREVQTLPVVEASTDIAQAHATLAAATTGEHANGFAALPENFKIHDLESEMLTRRRARNRMTTPAAPSFALYTLAHAESGASVYADPASMSAEAVLNVGTPAAPGHGDNTALWKPEATAPYKALRDILREDELSQRDVAEFIEDWEQHIGCAGAAGDIPALTAAQVVRNITVEAVARLHSEVEALSQERTTFESVNASGRHGDIPTHISLTCAPYADFEERIFVLRLGVHTADKTPRITLRLAHEEKHRQEMAEELARVVEQTLSDIAPSGTVPPPVYIGTWGTRP